MSVRQRESGDHNLSSLNGQRTLYYMRKSYDSNGAAIIDEWPVIDTYSSPSFMLDTRSMITDEVATCKTVKGCTHDRRYPFRYDLDEITRHDHPLASEIPANQDIMVGSSLGNVGGNFTIDSFLPNGVWPDSGFSREIDWSNLVTNVGARLDGSLTASTNILVCLGELAETIRMFKNPFGLLTTNWSKVLTTGKTLRQLSQAGANVWLEYKYGWKNFFRDFDAMSKAMDDARKHVKYLQNTRDAWSSVSESQHDEFVYSMPGGSVVSPLTASFSVSNLKVTRDSRFSIDILRGEHFRVLSQGEYALERMGGGLLIPALWDLVPMSFVLDWFVDVQRYLKTNLAYSSMHQLRHACYSTKTKWSGSVVIDRLATGWAGGESYDQVMLHDQTIRSLYTRTGGFPPSTQSAGIFGGLNLMHFLDASALIAQRI